MRLVKPGFRIMPHLEYSVMLKNLCTAVAHCYKAPEPQGQKAMEDFIRPRVKAGHASVLEHVGFSVDFTVDRGVTHEMVRHRISSFTQESTRYCNYSKDKFGGHVTYVMPPLIQALDIEEGEYTLQDCQVASGVALVSDAGIETPLNEEDRAAIVWLSAMASAEMAYLHSVSHEVGTEGPLMYPEIARGMLPTATKAEITWSTNMREWRHVFRLRAAGTTGRPHPQMAEVMIPLYEECCRRFPVFFEDLACGV